MHIFSPPAVRAGRLPLAAALVLSLALAGCATVPPPNDVMNLAQTRLQQARDAGAADYAPVDMGFAQGKFQQAQEAMADRKYADAANLAEESRADSELAQAKAKLGAARAQMQQKMQENTRLREEGEQAEAEAKQQMQWQMQQDLQQAPAGDDGSLPDQELPVPSTSVLPQPAGDGFQTLPDNPPQTDIQGGQR